MRCSINSDAPPTATSFGFRGVSRLAYLSGEPAGTIPCLYCVCTRECAMTELQGNAVSVTAHSRTCHHPPSVPCFPRLSHALSDTGVTLLGFFLALFLLSVTRDD
ncbi:hypothetical protein KC19_4G146700 [Ceratodon purpureus]|uniref:Uncharacterized protein n=1 Tax=Ceratodon purpureus TaxID=3225 RepID=A0A8T0ICD3_CERPU|nr:hypothetical protein KC19_4G146700 [Ceratodon purpureus]